MKTALNLSLLLLVILTCILVTIKRPIESHWVSRIDRDLLLEAAQLELELHEATQVRQRQILATRMRGYGRERASAALKARTEVEARGQELEAAVIRLAERR